MFTGLVQAVGRVAEISPMGGGVRLLIDLREWDYRPEPGESICVSGCCLTVVEASGGSSGTLAFDVVPETLSKTTLGWWFEGSWVNLERSMRAGDLMGGHMVQGHVDGVGTVEHVERGEDWRVTVRPPPGLMPYLVPKGSICIDGVSLTVADVDPGAGVFDVALIPVTLDRTTLRDLAPGAGVNLEADVLAKTIVQYMRHYTGRAGQAVDGGFKA
jgi:riboflavin synthase